ncbi:MAG: hypothetical protein H6963_03700 [Chromatiaceae bacterium]|nr:hypothetical protein [Chromatiaceae bacterium]
MSGMPHVGGEGVYVWGVLAHYGVWLEPQQPTPWSVEDEAGLPWDVPWDVVNRGGV